MTITKTLPRSGEKIGTGIRYHTLGANKSVTGSMHFFEFEDGGKTLRFCVDAGMHQEDQSRNLDNRLPKGVKASDLDFIIISHDHYDHYGDAPTLRKLGFRGPVYTTRATKDLLAISLPDSGHVQEMQAREKKERPRYTKQDAVALLQQVQAKDFYAKFSPAKNVTVQFVPSSHLLGAASVVLDIGSGTRKRRIVFSGDIGRKGMPCLKDATAIAQADYVICESTYGNRLHPDRDRKAALAEAIDRAYKRARNKHPVYGAGKIIIPVFAIGRAQSVQYDLRALDTDIPVYIDSPMSIKATEVYRRHIGDYPKADQLLAKRGDLFRTRHFAECMSKGDSARLDDQVDEPIIILSSSGMASGGRILEHLKHALQGARNSVIFVGHQADGTNGAVLTAGEAKTICIDGEDVTIRAHVELLEDYSAHGDYRDLLDWLSGFKTKPRHVFLVHGDEEAATAFKAKVEETLGFDVSVPEFRSCFELA